MILHCAITQTEIDRDRETGDKRDFCWHPSEDDWPRGMWCRRCTALEPLLREEGS